MANAQQIDDLDDSGGQETLDGNEIAEYVSQSEDSSVEDRARSLGWKPEEEFTGDSSKWTDAESFLQVHGRNNGALRKANEKLNSEIAALKRQNEHTAESVKKIYELQLKKANQEHNAEISFLKAQRKEAVRAGDHDSAEMLDEQLEAARERGPDVPDMPAPVEKPAQQDWQNNPDIVSFMETNTWVEADQELGDFFVGTATSLKKQYPQITLPQLMERAAKVTKQTFPQKFGATARRSGVEGSTTGATSSTGGQSRGSTYNAMPKEARDMCDSFVADRIMTREAYVKTYFESESAARGR